MRRRTINRPPVHTFSRRLVHEANEYAKRVGLKQIDKDLHLPAWEQLEDIMALGDAWKVADVLALHFTKVYDPTGKVERHVEVMRKFVSDNKELVAEVVLTYVPRPKIKGRRFP